MKRTLKTTLSVLTALVLVASLTVTSFAASLGDVTKSYKATAKYVFDQNPTSSNSALAQIVGAGVDVGTAGSDYVANITADVQANGGVTYSGAVSALSTAQAIIALDALGEDYTDVAGVNLISVLENESDWQSLMAVSPYSVCTALRAATLTGASSNCVSAIIDALMSTYTTEGDAGFDYWGISTDTNAQYIMALAPYCDTRADVKEAVEASLATVEKYLVAGQGYKYNLDNSYGEPAPNTDSTGLALAMYSVLGDEEKADAAYDMLQNFYVGDGAYGWADNTTPNAYATADALTGLAAYYQLKSESSDEPEDEKVYSPKTADAVALPVAVVTVASAVALVSKKRA